MLFDVSIQMMMMVMVQLDASFCFVHSYVRSFVRLFVRSFVCVLACMCTSIQLKYSFSPEKMFAYKVNSEANTLVHPGKDLNYPGPFVFRIMKFVQLFFLEH